jgi:hypothetical protein
MIVLYGSLDPTHGLFRVNTSGPSTSLASGTYNGSSAFLAAQVPLYIASGLDPRNEHTITLENAGGAYLDFDYMAVYKVGGGGPPGGELNAKSNNVPVPVLIGAIVGGVLGKHPISPMFKLHQHFPSGLVILAALIYYFIRRRRPQVRQPYETGVEKPARNVFGPRLDASVQVLHPELSSPISPYTESSHQYFPTPYTVQDSTSAPSTSGSVLHPLLPRGAAAPMTSPRHQKLAEIDHARRLAVVGGAVSSSSASASDTHLPLSPDRVTVHRPRTAPDSPMVRVDAAPFNTTGRHQRSQSSHVHDTHPVGLPDEPPPEYDAVA